VAERQLQHLGARVRRRLDQGGLPRTVTVDPYVVSVVVAERLGLEKLRLVLLDMYEPVDTYRERSAAV